MPEYVLRGVRVQFPYNAYPLQLVYMERVIEALQTKQHALLESPTGTGKTLCLLCACLAWREHHMREQESIALETSDFNTAVMGAGAPRIIYASRTHSQIKHVIDELKRTPYRPKMCVLGSREQFCLHDTASKLRGAALNARCRALVNSQGCSYYKNVRGFLESGLLTGAPGAGASSSAGGLPGAPHPPPPPGSASRSAAAIAGDLARAYGVDSASSGGGGGGTTGPPLLDIEDLHKLGREKRVCPFYLSRGLYTEAELVFVPYNYLIDSFTRSQMSITLDSNTVVIFDEAHNLETACSDAASFDLPSVLLASCINEVEAARQVLGVTSRLQEEECLTLKDILLSLERVIAALKVAGGEGASMDAGVMYDLLAQIQITPQTWRPLLDAIDKITQVSPTEDQTQETPRSVVALTQFAHFIRSVFRPRMAEWAKYYKVYVAEPPPPQAGLPSPGRTLSFWCFNPGVALSDLVESGVRSVLLTSGTLSPMQSFAQELGIPFQVCLENPHIIDRSQVCVAVVRHGPTNKEMTSAYTKRDDVEVKDELGSALVNYFRMMPDGVLVFFPSYASLASYVTRWQQHRGFGRTLWEQMTQYKHIVVEPRDSAKLAASVAEFESRVRDENGAAFLAVCRGKVSEGLDFADSSGRAVIITGIPFPALKEPKVVIKRKLLDELKAKGASSMSGSDWYTQQALRAINQAVGRVIRHRNDWGAIVFCESRMSNPAYRDQLSMWLRPYVTDCADFASSQKLLHEFFRRHRTAPAPRALPAGEALKTALSAQDVPDDVSEADRALLVHTSTGRVAPAPSAARGGRPPVTVAYEPTGGDGSGGAGDLLPAPDGPGRQGLLALRATAASEAKRQVQLVERAAHVRAPIAAAAAAAVVTAPPTATAAALPFTVGTASTASERAASATPGVSGQASSSSSGSGGGGGGSSFAVARASSVATMPTAEPGGRVSTREAIDAVRRAGGQPPVGRPRVAGTAAAAAAAESPLVRAFKRASESAPPRPAKMAAIDLTGDDSAPAAPERPPPGSGAAADGSNETQASSAGGTVSGGPSPGEMSVEAARAYLVQAKRALGPAAYEEFQTLLRRFRAKEISARDIMQRALELFAPHPALARDFADFLPPRHRAEYRARLSKPALLPSVSRVFTSNSEPIDVAALSSALRTPRPAAGAVATGVVVPMGATAQAVAAAASQAGAGAGAGESHAGGAPPSCMICMERLTAPFSAPCGHVACDLCWDRWLSEKLECPKCRQRVRRPLLRKIFF